MKFIAKRFRGRADMGSSDEIDGTPFVLRAKDYYDAIAICRENGLIYCHPVTDEPIKANGHDKSEDQRHLDRAAGGKGGGMKDGAI